jgi:hypothetical protein
MLKIKIQRKDGAIIELEGEAAEVQAAAVALAPPPLEWNLQPAYPGITFPDGSPMFKVG